MDLNKPESMDEKVAIVTAGRNGICVKTVMGLLEKGYRVVIGCRKIDVAEDFITRFNSNKVSMENLDLRDMKSIEKFVDDFKMNNDHLDLLVNNSGVLTDNYEFLREWFEMEVATNYLGHYLLTELLFEHLRKSKESRIVNVSWVNHIRRKPSLNGLNALEYDFNTVGLKEKFNKVIKDNFSSFNFLRMYNLATILFTISVSKKLKEENIQNVSVYCLYSNMGLTNLFDEPKTGVLSFFFYRYFIMQSCLGIRPGAETILHCALEKIAPKHNGWYFKKSKPEWNFAEVPKYAQAADALWEFSEAYNNNVCF